MVRGKVRWISDDAAYVLVPYGTAMTSRQQWEATVLDAGEKASDPPKERHLSVQLIAADRCLGTDEETEGLLLRLLNEGMAVPSAHRVKA